MTIPRRFKVLAGAVSIAAMLTGGVVFGQGAAAQWAYAFISNVATAAYPGNVTIAGNLSVAGSSTVTVSCASLPALTGDVTTPPGCATTIASNAVTNAKLAQATTRTLKGNGTASTANVTDIAAGQFPATQTNDSACVGCLGEYLTATGTGVAIANASAVNITSKSLTAGDWDCQGSVNLHWGAGTNTALIAGISTVSQTQPAWADGNMFSEFTTFSPSQATAITFGPTRISLTAPTTYFLVGTIATTVGSTVDGTLSCRRPR